MSAAGAVGEPFRRHWDWRTRLSVALGGWLMATLLRLLYLTLRVTCVDPSDALGRHARGERMVVAFWHDAVALMPLLPHRLGWPGRVNVLLSWHKDAEIAGRAMRRLGIGAVRGSSTRGFVGGWRGLLGAHARGEDVAIVPDGPRGPRHKAKDGVVHLAHATGAPIVAFGAAAWPARRLGSWDRMQLPRPFARVAIVISEPLVVARGDAVGLDEARTTVEAMLAQVNAAAAASVGAPT